MAVSVGVATRSPGIRLSAFVSSAVIPAAKYASLVSRLMLTSGITAIDFAATGAPRSRPRLRTGRAAMIREPRAARGDRRENARARERPEHALRPRRGWARSRTTNVPLTTAGSSSARATSAAVRGRFAGSFSSSFMISDASASGTS